MGDLTRGRQGSKDFSGCYSGSKPLPPASVLRSEPLPRLFRAVEQAFHQEALYRMRQEGVDGVFPGATPLILHLGDEDGLTISELARRCGLESSTMTPLVDELERCSIAVRARAPEDRRQIRLFLTETGRELEPRLRALLIGLQEDALRGIPEAELSVMHGVLERIVANLLGSPPVEETP